MSLFSSLFPNISKSFSAKKKNNNHNILFLPNPAKLDSLKISLGFPDISRFLHDTWRISFIHCLGNLSIASLNKFGQHRNLNSELPEDEFRVMTLDQRYVQCIQKFIIDRTSQSEGTGIRAFIFNRCNDATVRTREVPLVHSSCDVITLSGARSKFCTSCGGLPLSARR